MIDGRGEIIFEVVTGLFESLPVKVVFFILGLIVVAGILIYVLIK
jgi:hypothetical protein